MSDLSKVAENRDELKAKLDIATKTLQALADLDCGDNSCMFVLPAEKKGMRTNGGCRCLRYEFGLGNSPYAAFHIIKLRARKALEDMKEVNK